MSIPIAQLVYAGVWNSTTTYAQYYFVVSPIDSLCYINIDAVPISGGSDPSVQPSSIWLLFPNVSGDITGIVASTGLSGGGTTGSVVIANAGVLSVGATGGCASTGGQNPVISNSGVLSVSANNGCASTGGQNPTISNTGVLSLDSATGALTTKCGQWYKTSDQLVNTYDAPTVSVITFDASTSWTDTSCISYDAVGKAFNVLKNGVYAIQIQMMYDGFDVAHFNNDNHILEFTITRTTPSGTSLNSPIRNFNNWSTNDVPSQPDTFINGMYELKVGDVIQIHTIDDLKSPNTFTIKSQSTPAINNWDFNTFFSWNLIKPLP